MSKQSEEITKRKEPKIPKFPWWIAVSVLALWFINLGWGVWAMDNNPAKGGEWGDIFGAVNALFSVGSILLIYHGIRMQRYEVELAKAELAESKKQTLAQKVALDKQNEATERQMFENTFFKLLDNVLSEHRNATTSAGQSGSRAFANFAMEFLNNSNGYIERLNNNPNYTLIDSDGYSAWVFEYATIFSGYLRANESLLSYLNNNYRQYREYSKFISNRVSENELIILSLSPLVADQFKPLGALIKKYNIIRPITTDQNINSLVALTYKAFYGDTES